MLEYLKHHLRSGAPLMALGGLIAGVAAVSSVVDRLASAEQSGGLLAVLGEGIDELSVRIGGVGSQLSFLFSDGNTWIGIAALTATIVTVVSAFRQVSEWVHGPADAMALVEHASQHAVDALGVRPTRIGWGTVHDAESGRPLPFARVEVFDARGSVVARTIADVRGHYGFHISADALFERGGVGGLYARKDGYHHDAGSHPVFAGLAFHRMNIPMKQRAWLSGRASYHPGAGRQLLNTVAFWTGVTAVPMAFIAHRGIVGQALIALFAFSAIVRAVGSGRRSVGEYNATA